MNNGKLVIPVQVSAKKFYDVYTRVIDIMYNLKLANKQIELLAHLLLLYNEYVDKGVDDSVIWEIILSTSSRKDMCNILAVNTPTLNNIISSLRKIESSYGKLLIDNKINDKFLFKLNTDDNINMLLFKFLVKNGNSTTNSSVRSVISNKDGQNSNIQEERKEEVYSEEI